MSSDPYHSRPEWSYSQMKIILDSGIDYAVANKKGMLEPPSSKAIDLGELAHMFVLGGDADCFIVTPYADFRTKEARDWKAGQIEAGKTIVTKEQYDAIAQIVDNIENHPISKKLLKDKNVKPDRVQYHHAEQEFLEHGETKLADCLRQIKDFGDKEPNFLIREVNELGDWSL